MAAEGHQGPCSPSIPIETRCPGCSSSGENRTGDAKKERPFKDGRSGRFFSFSGGHLAKKVFGSIRARRVLELELTSALQGSVEST